MRTTVNIDDDILFAAKELAERDGTSLGRVLSNLARVALTRPEAGSSVRNGIPLFPVRPGIVVSSELIRRLDDELDL